MTFRISVPVPHTFINTLAYVMEAAAENNISVMVLDRPNPLNGARVEGNILDLKFRSFVGQYPIPYVYGMTCGEFAQMLNNEGWLDGGKEMFPHGGEDGELETLDALGEHETSGGCRRRRTVPNAETGPLLFRDRNAR